MNQSTAPGADSRRRGIGTFEAVCGELLELLSGQPSLTPPIDHAVTKLGVCEVV